MEVTCLVSFLLMLPGNVVPRTEDLKCCDLPKLKTLMSRLTLAAATIQFAYFSFEAFGP